MRSYQQICPIAQALDIVGERWTLLILRELFFGRTKFSELQERVGSIPVRILSDRLKKLQEHGIIERRVYSEHPLRAEYVLTDKGRTLRPVLASLLEWSMENVLSSKQRAVVLKHAPVEVILGG